MKKIFALVLVFVLILGITPAVFANPCCDLGINEITQDNDTVTVSYGYMNNGVTNREITLTVRANDSYRNVVEASQYVSDYYGEGSFTFSSAELLNGYSYRVEVYYSDTCASENCSWGIGETQTITIQGGIPVFDYAELDKGKLELVGASTAGMKATVSSSGFYKIAAMDYDDEGYGYEDWSINIDTYPNEYRVYPNEFVYLSAGMEYVYIVSTEDGSDLSTVIVLEEYPVQVLIPLTTNLQTTTKLFSVSGVQKLLSIQIPKYGVYQFGVTGCEEYNTDFTLMDAEGDYVDDSRNGTIECLMSAGTYYINATWLDRNYTMDITYIVPDAVEFGKSYTLETNTEVIYKMNIAKPVLVTFTGNSAELQNDNNRYSFYPSEPFDVVVPGEYFVTVRNHSQESQQFSFTQEALQSMLLDTATTPEVYARYRYYLVFCAPEDGKYEFDFSKCNDYDFVGVDDYSDASYRTVEMKKDECLLISLYNQEEVTVRKYLPPTAVSLTFDQTAYFDYYSGKTYLYSFTPSEDGEYKVVSSNNYCRNLKIYTDSETLYESTDAMWSYSKIVELKKDTPVYIELHGDSTVYGDNSQNNIKVTHAYTELTNGSTISLSNKEDITMCYTVSETAFYEVALSKTGSWMYAAVEINDRYYNVYANSATKAIVHCMAGEKIYFNFWRYDGSWSDVTVNITEINPTELTKDVETELIKGNYYSYTPSEEEIVRIEQSTFYGCVDVATADCQNIALNTDGAGYFHGKAGETYLLCPYEDVTATIKTADTEDITLGASNSAESELKIFVLDVPKEGYYKIDTELCNSELYIWCDDYWYTVNGTFYYMHKLEEGLFPIIYKPDNSENEAVYPSTADFTVRECTDNEELSVSLDDCFVAPSYDGMMATAQLTVTTPYAVEEVAVGLEYKDASGEKNDVIVSNTETMFTDKMYVEGTAPELALGKTYQIKPFVYIGEDYQNKIYGEEKTITLAMKSNIETLKYNSYKFKTEGHSKFERYGSQYYFRFTQPADATGKTYINHTNILSINLFDAMGNYIDTEYEVNGISANLTGGANYYMRVSSHYDGDAEINILSLPEASASSSYAINVLSLTATGISCTISGSGTEDAILYAAFYDGLQFVKAKQVTDLADDITIPLENSLVADSCKLILVDKTSFTPLCESEIVYFRSGGSTH